MARVIRNGCHDNFLRVLKRLEAFQLYLAQGEIVILSSWKQALKLTSNLEETLQNKALRDAFQAVSNRTLYLVSATIQVALWHHLDDELSQQLSVTANTQTARQLAKSPVSTLAMAPRKAVVMMARDTRINAYSQLATALPMA